MKKTRLVFWLSIISPLHFLFAQNLWTGPMIQFQKSNYADWTLAENQDRITDSVWITRANNRGIFNIVLEEEYDKDTKLSPLGTEWAIGSIADGIENLEFTTWNLTNLNPPPEEVGIHKVLHLISEDIYIDIVITAWTPGGGGSGTGFGGGFTYLRSTPPISNTQALNISSTEIFPNPARDYLYVKNATEGQSYSIYNAMGQRLCSGKLSGGNAIAIYDLTVGVYLLQLDNLKYFKFMVNRD